MIAADYVHKLRQPTLSMSAGGCVGSTVYFVRTYFQSGDETDDPRPCLYHHEASTSTFFCHIPMPCIHFTHSTRGNLFSI